MTGKTKVETILCVGANSEAELPTRLLDWPAFIQGLIEQVPEALRDTATVFFGNDGDWDHPQPEFAVDYERPETEEEAAQRAAAEQFRAKGQELHDLADFRQYLALKEKFEGGGKIW